MNSTMHVDLQNGVWMLYEQVFIIFPEIVKICLLNRNQSYPAEKYWQIR